MISLGESTCVQHATLTDSMSQRHTAFLYSHVSVDDHFSLCFPLKFMEYRMVGGTEWKDAYRK